MLLHYLHRACWEKPHKLPQTMSPESASESAEQHLDLCSLLHISAGNHKLDLTSAPPGTTHPNKATFSCSLISQEFATVDVSTCFTWHKFQSRCPSWQNPPIYLGLWPPEADLCFLLEPPIFLCTAHVTLTQYNCIFSNHGYNLEKEIENVE